MQRFAILLGTLGLAMVIMVGSIALFPAKAEAGCSPVVRSVNGWAFASTCQASRNACEADAFNNADNSCYFGLCAVVGVTFTNNCVPQSGGFFTDCVMQYKCTFKPFQPF